MGLAGRLWAGGCDREISPVALRLVRSIRDLGPPHLASAHGYLNRVFLPTFYEPKSTFTPSGGEVGTAEMNIRLDRV